MSEFSANDRDEESNQEAPDNVAAVPEEAKSEFSVNDRSLDAPVSINNNGVEYQAISDPQPAVSPKAAVMNTDLTEQIAKQYETKGVTVDQVVFRQTLNERRVQFNLSFAKLFKQESQMQGWQECLDLIKAHSDDRNTFRVFISAVTDKAILSNKPIASGVARHALIFGELAKQFKNNFVDPIDKPPTRKKTYERILTFMASSLFQFEAIDVQQNCAKSMIQIMANVFPECLQDDTKLADIFIKPLLNYIAGASKPQLQTTCLCVSEIAQFSIKSMTPQLAALLTFSALKHKIYDSNYTELICVLMKHCDISQLNKQMFEFTINGLKHQQQLAEKAAWSVFGKPLDDMLALIKLQTVMVQASQMLSQFVVPFHYQQAVDGLVALKQCKNAKLQVEIGKAIVIWGELKMKFKPDTCQRPKSLNEQRNEKKMRGLVEKVKQSNKSVEPVSSTVEVVKSVTKEAAKFNTVDSVAKQLIKERFQVNNQELGKSTNKNELIKSQPSPSPTEVVSLKQKPSPTEVVSLKQIQPILTEVVDKTADVIQKIRQQNELLKQQLKESQSQFQKPKSSHNASFVYDDEIAFAQPPQIEHTMEQVMEYSLRTSIQEFDYKPNAQIIMPIPAVVTQRPKAPQPVCASQPVVQVQSVQQPIQVPVPVPVSQPIQVPIQAPVSQPIQMPIQASVSQPIQVPVPVPVSQPIQVPIQVQPQPDYDTILKSLFESQVSKMQQQLLSKFDSLSQKLSQVESTIKPEQPQADYSVLQEQIAQQQQQMVMMFENVQQEAAKIQEQTQQLKQDSDRQLVSIVLEAVKQQLQKERAVTPVAPEEPVVVPVQVQRSSQDVRVKRTKPIPRLTQVWLKCAELVKVHEYKKAYDLMLKEGDDMYLLRLIVQTGPVTKYLTYQQSQQVLERLNKIVRRNVIGAIEVEWIDDSKRAGHFKNMPMSEQNEYLDTLYLLGSQDDMPRAQEVYASIKR